MASATSKVLELVGAFLLGGGVVAVGYELITRPSTPDDATAAATPDPGAEDGQPASPASIYAGAGEELAGDAEGGDAPAVDPETPAVEVASEAWLQPDEAGSYAEYPGVFLEVPPMDAEAESEYPRHGLVTSLAAIVRERADLESPILGILRAGTRIRVDEERTFGGGCSEGWNKVYPRGWMCRKAGLKVDETPPDDGVVQVPAPKIDRPLPYDYWRVKDEMTPFFHRLPSFSEQDKADSAGRAWYAEHKREPMPTDRSVRPGEVPAVVKEYMNSGYYITKAGEELKSERRFVRTTLGSYARKYQLKPKESPKFQGRVLPGGAKDLPLYFIRREIAFKQREGELSDVLVDTDDVPERLTTHPFVRSLQMGPKAYYEDADGKLMRAYAVGKAYKLKRPPGVKADEHWVHVDLSEQTLVAYDGDVPVFATLVSTGKEAGMTPIGVHRVQIKHIATPMRDQPQEEEAYSIDDVPWTQYFSGSIALHGAFWHAGFGQVRSHGCVNLSPADARWLFGFTEPHLPEGWHAIAPLGRGQKGSAVVVTE
ncbi:MAG: L,D-transpeptidase family protein [Myxococcota bacterium]